MAAVPGASTGVTGRASGRGESRAFAPVDHGYGFRNWASRDQPFEAPPNPSRQSVRERVRTDWRRQAHAVLGLDMVELPTQLTDAIATQLRLAVVQRAGTNGHCYGMCLTAQRYFERPETIPVDRQVASEIDDPTVPVEEPDAPVYEEIVQAQAAQFLGFRAWLGRRGMLRPGWVDTERVLRDVQAVIETSGTATLSVFDRSARGHQVLAYGFEEHDDGVTIPLYDPNLPARAYHHERPALRFDRDGDTTMQPYDGYTNVLFNRYDQIERATGRQRPTPLDHTTVDAATLRSLYGAPPGTYRIGVFGTGPTDYELTTSVNDTDGTVVEAHTPRASHPASSTPSS